MFEESASMLEQSKKPYEIMGSLGMGGYAEVYRVRKVQTGELFALKRIKRYRLNDPKVRIQVDFEIKLMKEMNHPNIIRMYEATEDDEYVNMILELAEGGSLYDRLQHYGKFTEGRVIRCVKDIVNALEYLHIRDQPIIHRDLKPENILLDSDGNCKVTDFGCSNIIDLRGGTRYTYAGTQIYMAPQMVSNVPYTESIDLWNVGVMIYQLLTGDNPFAIQIDDPIAELITKMDIHFPEDFPILARDVVKRLLQKQPSQRMTLKQLKNHIWLTIDIEEPLVRTYCPSQTNTKLEEANKALQILSRFTEAVGNEKREIDALKKQIQLMKQQRAVLSKREELPPAQYFQLSETLNNLKSQFADNQNKLKKRHQKMVHKAEKVQQKEKVFTDQISRYRALIDQLQENEPRLMVKIRQNFRQANQRLADFITCIQRFPDKVRQDMLYVRQSRVAMPHQRDSLDILQIENQTLKFHMRVLEQQKRLVEQQLAAAGQRKLAADDSFDRQ